MTVKYEKNSAKENIEWCESCIPAGLHKTSLLKQIKTKKKKKKKKKKNKTGNTELEIWLAIGLPYLSITKSYLRAAA